MEYGLVRQEESGESGSSSSDSEKSNDDNKGDNQSNGSKNGRERKQEQQQLSTTTSTSTVLLLITLVGLLFAVFLAVLLQVHGLGSGGAEQDLLRDYERNKKHYKLRFDWTNINNNIAPATSSSLNTTTTTTRYFSPLAEVYDNHQRNCSLPLYNFHYRNEFGLGSDLHLWTQAICLAVEKNVRIRTASPWIYTDHAACWKKKQPKRSSSSNSEDQQQQQSLPVSAMQCYFPHSELLCGEEDEALARIDDESNHTQLPKIYMGTGWVDPNSCPNTRAAFNLSLSDVRAAGLEFLFRHVSDIVVQEAERQLYQVFGGGGTGASSSNGQPLGPPPPEQLITVHIRWGDKKAEMHLQPVENYVKAVEQILAERKLEKQQQQQQNNQTAKNDGDDPVHIFLSTEDPEAVMQFGQAAKDRNWTVYVDQYMTDFLPARQETYGSKYNGNPMMALDLEGHPGLVALGSLLVAMQANSYVLTTGSNWSRLMNELRKNIIEPSCGGKCTKMVDLHGGEWRT